jgi:hypothetical protein
MTEAFLIGYFENIAATCKDILHTDGNKAFYTMADPTDLVEFEAGVRSMSQNICLVLEMGTGTMGDYDAQNDTPRIGLHVLCKSATELYTDVRAARDQAKTTLNKIVSQMRLDCRGQYERPDNANGPLNVQQVTFDTKIKYANMSGIDGNWYGKSFYFEFRVPENLVYNPDDWN